MYALAGDGYSSLAIAKRLNDERVPTLGRAKMKSRAVAWDAPTVRHILTSRAALGEYIPYASDSKKPAGEPVPNYYPPVVDEATYYRAQAALKTRAAVGRGRKGKHVNLFAGLLTDARSGGPMTYAHYTGGCRLCPTAAIHGAPVKWASFPAKELERALLAQMKELTAKDASDDDTAVAKRIKTAEATIDKCDALLFAWRARMNDVRIIDTVAAKLAELEGQRQEAVEEREASRREAANSAADAIGELHTLADVLEHDNGDEMRLKVRAALRAVVESVHLLILADGNPKVRTAAVRVQFRGSRHRDYIIIAKAGRGATPATWAAESFADAGLPGLDLRDTGHAKRLEKALARARAAAEMVIDAE
jgi:hypothetical protein